MGPKKQKPFAHFLGQYNGQKVIKTATLPSLVKKLYVSTEKYDYNVPVVVRTLLLTYRTLMTSSELFDMITLPYQVCCVTLYFCLLLDC